MLFLRGYQALSALTLCAILADLAFTLFVGLRPVDVSGTLLGGGYGQLMFLALWCCVIVGLLVCSLMRLPGHWLAWGAAGVMQMGIGLWWRVGYPHDENLIYLPDQGYITGAVVVGLGMGALAVWRGRQPRRLMDPVVMGPKAVMALALAIAYIGVPLHNLLAVPLPYCAFDKAGNQLSICLGDDDERVIVD